MPRTLRFGTTLQPDAALQQDARYTLGQEDRQQIDTQIRELQTFAARAHLNGAHGTYIKLVGDDCTAGDVVCSGDGLGGNPTVKLATSAALAAAGVAIGVLLEAATSGSRALVAIGGVIAPAVTGLAAAAPGWVRVDASGRCERVDTLADNDVALGYVDAGGYLTLGIFPPSIAGTDLAAEKLLVDDTSTTLANGRALRALTATIPILAVGAVPLTVSHQADAGSVVEAFGIGRAITGGAAGTNGTGVSLAVRIPDAVGAVRVAGRLRWEWVSASALSPQPKCVLSLETGDGHLDRVTVSADGSLRLHGYIAGRLKTDATGNVTSDAITFDEVSAALAAATQTVDVGAQNIATTGAVQTSELTLKDGGSTSGRFYKSAGYAFLDNSGDTPSGLFLRAVAGSAQIEGISLTSLAANAGPVWLRPATGVTVFYRDTTVAANLFLDAAQASYLRLQARSGTGANAGNTFEVSAQPGQAVAAGTNNDGGALELRSGAAGTGGTGGAPGAVRLMAGATTRVEVLGDRNVAVCHALLAHAVDQAGNVSGTVSLDQHTRFHEMTIMGDTEFQDGPSEPATDFRIIAYRDAAVAPVLTWPAHYKFATGESAICATDNKYTIWDFHVAVNGDVHCTNRHTNE